MSIFLRGNVPSSKNSRVNGKFFSKTVMKYLRSIGIQGFSSSKKTVKGYKDLSRPNLFEETLRPYFSQHFDRDIQNLIGFHFVRNTKRKFDFGNICQILLDLLTAHDMIDDDSADKVLPVPLSLDGKYYSVDKDNPGVYIEILRDMYVISVENERIDLELGG